METEIKYAVYVVVVEDPEAEDMELAMQTVSFERVEGGMSIAEANDTLADLVYEGRHF